MKEWNHRNPGKKAIIENRRRALKLGCDGEHYTNSDVERIFNLQRGKCAYCRFSLDNGYQVDHITPLSRGGSNVAKNIQLLCKKPRESCNQRKRAKDPLDFAQSIGLLL